MSQCPADVPVINKDHWASLYSAVKALESMTVEAYNEAAQQWTQ